MPYRLSLVFCFLTFAGACHADLLSTASVNPFGPCGLPQMANGTDNAAVTVCSYPMGGTASTDITFNVTQSSLSSFLLYDGAGSSTVSNSSSSFDYKFVVTGGSGTGFLTLNYVQTSEQGDNDPQASTSYSLAAMLNGVQYSNLRICANKPAQEGIVCPNSTDAIGFNFTYGVPFELSVNVNGVAGGGLARFVPFTYIKAGGVLDYSLPSSSDVLSVVTPEPAPLVLFLVGGVLLGMKRARSRNAHKPISKPRVPG